MNKYPLPPCWWILPAATIGAAMWGAFFVVLAC